MGLFGGKKKNKDAQSAPQAGAAKSDTTSKDDAPVPQNGDGPPEFSDKAKASARKWFVQAEKLVGDRNFEYAIESYLTGLKFWPDAVEEGHLKLRVAAYSRGEKGGKRPGTIDVMKHSMSAKDPLTAFLNAEWLWARDPTNISFIEGMTKNAARAGYEETLLFIGPIFFEAIKNEKKTSKDRLLLLRKSYELLGERCERRRDMIQALKFFEGAMTVLTVLNNLSGQNKTFSKELQDTATKVTMIKGQYGSAEDFRGSIKDADAQKDLHDQDRLIVDQDRLGEMIAAARAEWEANPGVLSKLLNLAEVLVKKEDDAREKEAISLLEKEFDSNGNYQLKMRADDIRIRQLQRRVRKAELEKDVASAKESKIALLRLELASFKARIRAYPTDNKLKFRYGQLLIRARKFDEAIPILQEARNDPKNRVRCLNLIGRCFFEKGFHSQAVTTYNQAISDHETAGDDLSKELHYWLGRSCQSAGKNDEAEGAFSQVIQWDYNFRDTRKRLAEISGSN